MNVFFANAFTSGQSAKDFFKNAVQESASVSGAILSAKGGIGFIKDGGPLTELGDGEELFLVLTYPKAVTVEVDPAIDAGADEANEEGEAEPDGEPEDEN